MKKRNNHIKTEIIIAKAILFIVVFPNLFGVILALFGIRSFVSLVAYSFAFIYLLNLGIKKHIRDGLWPLILYLLFFLFSYSYSISLISSTEKVINIIYNIFIPICLIVLLLSHSKNDYILKQDFEYLLEKYSPLIILFLLILLILGFTEISEVEEGRSTIIGMRNPIWCSRFVGFLALSLILQILREKRIAKLTILGLSGALVIMISSGSRGPLLAILFTIFFFFFPKLKFGYKIFFLLIIFCGYELFINYSARLSEGSVNYSNLARIELLKVIFSVNLDYLKGCGIGGFGIIFKGEDYYYYPHNILVETFLETGLIGTFLLLILLISVFKKKKKNNIFFIYTTYFFINSLFSGDIAGNNNLFIFASLVLLNNSDNLLTSSVIKSKKRIHDNKESTNKVNDNLILNIK